MDIPEKIKTMAKNFGSICVNAYNDYSTALNDYTRLIPPTRKGSMEGLAKGFELKETTEENGE